MARMTRDYVIVPNGTVCQCEVQYCLARRRPVAVPLSLVTLP